MLNIKEAIITEGKYDKIKIKSVVNCTIVETNGFRIFKDTKKINLIRALAKSTGIIILTDSDASGFIIRNYIKTAVQEGTIKHAYIPNVMGKEKRKSFPSKEGKLGVEGISKEIILRAIKLSCTETNKDTKEKITHQDLYECGLLGKDQSKIKRLKLLNHLKLPEYISTNEFINILNCFYSKDEFKENIALLLKSN